ncbi:MAG TPA: PadR family transcriptional regulator [Jatrophihabitans sp.]|nr:PadR family transcriptional regulator [Jatrophihabitans sp.]
MPIHHAVLALLTDGPSHGYQLKAEFERSVGPQWGTLNIGHLYQVLARLSDDGLVSSERQFQSARPDRVVYALTDEGAAELDRWLTEPSERQAGYRDDFFLKLMAVTRRADPAARTMLIDRQRGHLLGELRTLGELARSAADDLVVSLLIDAAQLHVQAELTFLDRAEARLARGTELSAPAETEVTGTDRRTATG